MKEFYKLTILGILMMMAGFINSQDSCEDPNAFSMTTDCGTEFDLCIDRYIMDNHDAIELEVFTNDMGMFDPCVSYIAGECSNGSIDMLPNCNFMYAPDEGFVGNDTFYYAMVINDSCAEETYCENGDGKIWTVNSRYKGPNGLDVVVNSKKGNSWEYVGTAKNLQDGEYFLIDGAHLSKSQANWTYTFYAPNGVNGCETDSCFYEDIVVHTSCSQQIMGKDFGLFRVVSGCIATTPNKLECSGSSRNVTYSITTQWTDTTMVVITVPQSLPIEIANLKASHFDGNNRITWEVLSVINEDYIEVEKSTDGRYFYPINKIQPITVKAYYVDDMECLTNDITYYRLKMVSMDGSYQYSDITSIRNKTTNSLQIRPNPTDGDITIEHNGDDEFSYEVIDIFGEMKYKNDSHSATNTVIPFSMLGLNTGTYILIIDFGNGDVHYEKIVFIGH